MRIIAIAVVLFVLSLAACGVHAGPGYVSVISENDIYAPWGQDRHYSNGLRLGSGLKPDADARWYGWLGKVTPLGVASDYEIALGQNIYTPEFFITSRPLPQDRPYAGWLYGELIATARASGMEESLAVNLGVVGPLAMGEQLQKIDHEIVGDPEPAGWGHQLANEPALLVRYRRSWFRPLKRTGLIQAGFITRLGVNLGNVFTDAGTGLVLRLGNHLPERELPLRVQPGLSGNSSNIEVRAGRFDWMWYSEVQGRAVARNIFLDGNTFRDSLSVDKRPLVWDAATGMILGFGQFHRPLFISFSIVWRGREFDLQQGLDSFGSALIGLQF